MQGVVVPSWLCPPGLLSGNLFSTPGEPDGGPRIRAGFSCPTFVMKNGLYHTHVDLPASEGETKIETEDADPVTG